MTPDPFAERIFTEADGDINRAVARLKSLHWTEEEAVTEIDACLAALKEPARGQAKRSGASHG